MPKLPTPLLLLLLSSLLLLHINRRLLLPSDEEEVISFSLEEQHLPSVALATSSTSSPPSRTFPLERCTCSRSLPGPPLSLASEPPLSSTTCGRDAWARGSHQKVVAFSFYGSPNSSEHQAKQYWRGIQENVALVVRLYGEGWSVRLYHDLPAGHALLPALCRLACAAPALDLCQVDALPAPSLANASLMFPMVWRFLPTLDPQVDVFLCRDLDSRVSPREVAAVGEWLGAGAAVHSMRDHPAHNTPLLGAAWGALLAPANLRHKWARAWTKMEADPVLWSGREMKGPDQELLTRHVWPWARHMATQHDSYTCTLYPGTRGFPTQREDGENNFVAAVVAEGGGRLWKRCPRRCRRDKEWEHC